MKAHAIWPAIAALAFAVSAEAQPPSVEAFGRLPAVSQVAISPDGRRVVLARSDAAGQANVAVVDLDTPANSRAYPVDAGSQLRGAGWAGNTYVTFVLTQTYRAGDVMPPSWTMPPGLRRIQYMRNGVINLDNGNIELLTTHAAMPWLDFGSDLIPVEGDPGFARLVGYSTRGRSQTIYRVDLNTGSVRHTPADGSNSDTVEFLLDERGAPLLRFDTDEDTNRWRMFVYENGRPRLLQEDESEFGGPLNVFGRLPDGRFVSEEYGDDNNYNMLHAINPADGTQEMFYRRENGDVDAAIVDRNGRVVGVTWIDDERRQHFFDAELQAAYDRVNAMFGGAVARLESWSDNKRRFIVYAERGLDGGGYYFFNRDGDALGLLAMRYPEVAAAAGGVRQAITYPARDGARIPAYLTLPAGEARNLPLVMLVHGGPHQRDEMDFDWWSSFLTARGYAVLQPNFRGSGGYGLNWRNAGRREWGGLMQTDVEDGVASLGRAGIIDTSRVCIVGASYGGYAALAGAALTPDLYKCAVSVAGVSDLEAMLRRLSALMDEDSRAVEYWRASIGDRDEDRDRIRAASPINHVADVRIPVLLIHGTDDVVVPIDQSRRMDRALRDAGKNVRFVELTGDDHWLSDAPTRIQMLREMETFLAQHLGN